MVRYETLKRFCSTNELRPSMHYVKRIGNNWYATDAYAVCRISEEAKHSNDILYLTDEYPDDLRFPNVEAVLPESVSDEAIQMSVEEIKSSLRSLRKIREYRDVEEDINYVECDCCECHGGKVTLSESIHYGDHYYDMEEEVDCPVCHGYGVIPDFEDYDPDDDYDPEIDKTHIVSRWTGRMIPDFESAIEIHGLTVKAKYLKLVTEVAEEMGTDIISVDRENDMLIVGMEGVLIGVMKCQK